MALDVTWNFYVGKTLVYNGIAIEAKPFIARIAILIHKITLYRTRSPQIGRTV